MTPGTPFLIGDARLRVDDMEVAPGNSAALVVAAKKVSGSPRSVGLAVFVDGNKLVQTFPNIANVIEFGATPNSLYGHNNETSSMNFYSFSIDLLPSGGVQLGFDATELVTQSQLDMEFDNGRMYFTNGQIADVNGPAPVGSLEANGPVEPVSSTGRTYFVHTNKLKAFSQSTFTPLGEMVIPRFAGGAQDLIALGGSAVAFTTASDQLFIVRLLGDYDASGVVSLADYGLWNASYGSTMNLTADANRNNIIDAADYVLWRDNLRQTLVGSVPGGSIAHLPVPEPSAGMLLFIGVVLSIFFTVS
jgi:hypothetical protein